MAVSTSLLGSVRTVSALGVDIAVYENGASGPAILFIHGNSASARAYRFQLKSRLTSSHRLVAYDLPGHGASGRATNPAETYSLPGYSAVLRSLIEQLGLQRALFVGWSLGGHIALEAAPELPDAAGFLIFGTPPLAFPPVPGAFKAVPEMRAALTAVLSDAETEAYLRAFFRPGYAPLPETFLWDIRRTDGRARAALAASLRPGGYRDEVAIVQQLRQPLAILHGDQEQLVNLDYLRTLKIPRLWRNAVQVVPNAGHSPQWEQPDAFNTLLAEFAEHTQGPAEDQ